MANDKSEGAAGTRRRRKTGTRKKNSYYVTPMSEVLQNQAEASSTSHMNVGKPPATLGGDLTGNLADFLNNPAYQPGGSQHGAASRPSPQRVAPQTTIKKKAATAAPVADPSIPYMDTGGDQFDALNALAMSMLTDTAGQSFDYETAIQDSVSALKKSYGAEIAAIRGNNRAARKQTKKDRKELEALYSGLAKSYGFQARQANQAGQQNAQEAMNIAAQGNQTIAATQAQTTGDQAQMLKDLGLEATADQIITPDFAQSAASQANITETGTNAAVLANQLGNNNQAFFRRGKAAARMEGANQQGDLMGQLRDYVRGNKDQIAVLKGQRAREISQTKSDTMAAAAEAEANSQADLWNRLMEYAGLQAEIENTNFDNNLAGQKFQYDQQQDRVDRRWDAKKWRAEQASKTGSTSTNSPYPKELNDAMQIIQEQSAQPQILAEILQGVWESKDFAYGQKIGQNGETYKLTPAMAANMAERAARQKGITSEQEIQAIRLAAYRSVG